ncbi:MAG: IPT/TIG domain-containing protein [Phycisphaerae bacterium]|nr:IPT/TIG domain-containing protein [Phycisphaerae bacterium]
MRSAVWVTCGLTLAALLGGCPPNAAPTAARSDARSSVIAVSPDRGPTLGRTMITIIGGDFESGAQVMFGSFLSPSVEFVSSTELRAVVPAQANGTYDIVVILPSGESFVAQSAYDYVAIADADSQIVAIVEQLFPGPPRLVSAISLGNTAIRLTFSEPVQGVARSDAAGPQGALDPTHYQITIPGGGSLVVNDGRDLSDPLTGPQLTFRTDQTVIDIPTLSQAGAEYVISVSGVTDLAGNPISPPDILVSPAQATFRGLAPVAFDGDPGAIHVDRDGDGFADWFEMLGWTVTVELANGVVTQSYVTSDPFDPDTDCDGLTDSEENARSLDPRTDDTDADRVSDCDETRKWLSNPADQDSDNDGLADESEINFNTSPALADTDGDQLTDRDEIVLRNRNPRVADLPLPQIRIGEMNLQIDERFTYTDEQGSQQTIESSSTNSFLQSDTDTLASSSTSSNLATDLFRQDIEAGYGDGSATGGGFVRVGAGFEQSQQIGYSATVSEESSRTAQREFSESLAEALSTSERREVTRSVDGAKLSVEVTVANAGAVAFTISNLELSARVQDPRNRDRFIPLAALQPASRVEAFSLGALQTQRGPFIFENAEIFPNLAQDLLREPRAIIFDVANYDIIDEFGRNFAFTSEVINDLTAGVLIDFGDGRVEQYRIATASDFVPVDGAAASNQGCDTCPPEGPRVARGIRMRQALAEIGLVESASESTNLLPQALRAPEVRSSFGTSLVSIDADGDGQPEGNVQILTRVRDVQSDLESVPRDKRFWVVMTPTGALEPTIDFPEITLRPRDDYQLWYTEDRDEDGLYARQEFLAESSDELVDTDGDSIGDFDEIETGWVVQTSGATAYRVFPHPARPDTDFDLLSDPVEKSFGTDPRLQDTDKDGIADATELEGYEVVRTNLDTGTQESLLIAPYSDEVIAEPRAGGNGRANTDAAGDDVQVVARGQTVASGQTVIRPGPNGVIDTVPNGDDKIDAEGASIVATSGGTVATATASGSDDLQLIAVGAAAAAGDVIIRAGPDRILQSAPAGSETIRAEHRRLFASDPLKADSDFDGLTDGREELLGSSPNDPRDAALDSDGDGLLDGEERVGWSVAIEAPVNITSDPFRPDTDGDGLPDALESALRTNPRLRDSDGDTITDDLEYRSDRALADYYGNSIASRLASFEARCERSANCVFTPNAASLGSNPLRVDSDSDTLRDDVEVAGWTVDVVDDEPPYAVTSDPTLGDTDSDGQSDSIERSTGTDPRLPDTDGDGVNEAVEDSQNDRLDLVGSGRRNPLKPDQLLRVDYDRFVVTRRCDTGGVTDEGEFQFILYVRTADGTRRELINSINNRTSLASECPGGGGGGACWYLDSCGSAADKYIFRMRDGDTINFSDNFRRSFVVGFDQSASLEATWWEFDGTTCNVESGFPFQPVRTLSGIQNADTSANFRYQLSASCDTRVDFKVEIIRN